MSRLQTYVLMIAVLVVGAGSARASDMGIMVDAGLPDGANASLAYKPWSFLRLHAGGGTNMVSPGFRTGLSLIWHGLSGTAEYGHYFPGDANGLWRNVSGKPDAEVPALREVGYDYANFRLGLEFGPRWLTFCMHVGMSYMTGRVKDLGPTLTTLADTDGATVTFGSDPKVSVWTVSARMGFIVYFGI